MKSIEDTLKLVNSIVIEAGKSVTVDIALVGGYAVIAHGVGRTTVDVDFLLYSEYIREESSPKFIELFKRSVPERFETRWVEGSKMFADPFPYDVLFLTDQLAEYPRMDFIIPRYKWELKGLRSAKPLEDIPFPVLSIPYLIAMKLRAGGSGDHSDIVELWGLLSAEDKEKTKQLAVLIKRDKNLSSLLKAEEMRQGEPEDGDLLI